MLSMRQLLAAVVMVVGCSSTSRTTGPTSVPVGPSTASLSTEAQTPAYSSVLHVRGLGCPLCATNVKKSLERLPGVAKVGVNLGDGSVLVQASTTIEESRLRNAVESAGFTLERVEPTSGVR